MALGGTSISRVAARYAGAVAVSVQGPGARRLRRNRAARARPRVRSSRADLRSDGFDARARDDGTRAALAHFSVDAARDGRADVDGARRASRAPTSRDRPRGRPERGARGSAGARAEVPADVGRRRRERAARGGAPPRRPPRRRAPSRARAVVRPCRGRAPEAPVGARQPQLDRGRRRRRDVDRRAPVREARGARDELVVSRRQRERGARPVRHGEDAHRRRHETRAPDSGAPLRRDAPCGDGAVAKPERADVARLARRGPVGRGPGRATKASRRKAPRASLRATAWRRAPGRRRPAAWPRPRPRAAAGEDHREVVERAGGAATNSAP